MKKIEKEEAISLREKGFSINDIARAVNVSKGTVSLWVRDIELTTKQRDKLTKRGFSVSAIEKRRVNRIENTRLKHQIVVDKAKQDINTISHLIVTR